MARQQRASSARDTPYRHRPASMATVPAMRQQLCDDALTNLVLWATTMEYDAVGGRVVAAYWGGRGAWLLDQAYCPVAPPNFGGASQDWVHIRWV